MIARFTTSIGSAVAVTFGLLFLMQLLIASDMRIDRDAKIFRIANFIQVVRPPQILRKIERPTMPPEAEDHPEVPSIDNETPGFPVERFNPTRPRIPQRVKPVDAVMDGDLLPIVTVAPHYPASAAQRDIEGHVIVEFVVAQTGSVSDVVVVESTHRVFERAAIEAASKFKYRPRVVNGQPVEVHGVRARITFVLEE